MELSTSGKARAWNRVTGPAPFVRRLTASCSGLRGPTSSGIATHPMFSPARRLRGIRTRIFHLQEESLRLPLYLRANHSVALAAGSGL